MAHMVPEAPPRRGPGSHAEGVLQESLRRLSDEFFVYHGLQFVERRGAREGEVDFLVVHRELGMLAIECKGRGLRRATTGEWFRGGPGGETPLRQSPAVQAQRLVKDLVRELSPRVDQLFPRLGGRFPLVHGHAVAFPLGLTDQGQLPLEIPPEILFDASDLGDMEERVRGALAFWRRCLPATPRPFTPGEFKQFRRHTLHPRLRIVNSVGARLEVGRQAFLRLTEEQLGVLRGVLGNKRLRVTGGAGTGKTVLALEAARRWALEGQRVLFVCFNRFLALHLGRLVDGWAIPRGSIDVLNFHQICFRACQLLGRDFVSPPPREREAATAFWTDEAPFPIIEALEADKLAPWDAIVIDEGQDFATTWFEILEECLAPGDDTRMAVFYDAAQNIFGRQSHVPDWPTSIELKYNFRNTRCIAEVVRTLGGVDMESHPDCPQGEPPSEHREGESASSLHLLERTVARLVENQGVRPDDIVILTPHTRPNSLLAGVECLAGLLVASDPFDRDGAVLHMTIGKYKGLEAEVVLFADVDPADPRCSRNARYVAASRARQELHVFSIGDWLES